MFIWLNESFKIFTPYESLHFHLLTYYDERTGSSTSQLWGKGKGADDGLPRGEATECRTQAQLDTYQQQLAETQETVACLKRDYNTLKTARMIEVSSEDVKESRAKLAHLIREVDKCIALLDV